VDSLLMAIGLRCGSPRRIVILLLIGSGLLAAAGCSSGDEGVHTSMPTACPTSTDDITSSGRWTKAAELKLPSKPSEGLLCFYRGGANAAVGSVTLLAANSKTLAGALNQTKTSSSLASCAVDEGNRVDIYLGDSANVHQFTLRFGGCYKLAGAGHFAYANTSVIDEINRLAPTLAHPVPGGGGTSTPSPGA
jgi:hypothetical protein